MGTGTAPAAGGFNSAVDVEGNLVHSDATDANESHVEAWDWATPDPLLKLIVDGTNTRTEPLEEGLSVTLLVGGQVVSGEIIPHWQWLEEQDHDGGNGLFGDIARSLRADAGLPADERPPTDITAHIHLRRASVFLPDPVPAEGAYWRCRLSGVSGWTLGILRVERTQVERSVATHMVARPANG